MGAPIEEQAMRQQIQLDKAYERESFKKWDRKDHYRTEVNVRNPDFGDTVYVWVRTWVPSWVVLSLILVGLFTVITVKFKKEIKSWLRTMIRE